MRMPQGSTFHRGIGYSVSDEGDGVWMWRLHPPIRPEDAMVFRPIHTGQVIGTREDAAKAAELAIDVLGIF
jgi:hypothetical protein